MSMPVRDELKHLVYRVFSLKEMWKRGDNLWRRVDESGIIIARFK